MRTNRIYFFSFIFLALSFFTTPVFAVQEYDIKAVLWYKTSGEMAALYEQAFNLARMRLDQILVASPTGKPRALIFDIDETVLDNTGYVAKAVSHHWNYPEGWAEWINSAKSKALPGVVEFCHYAAKRGVVLFFITNRDVTQTQASYMNLKNVGIPVARENVITRAANMAWSKESRRQKIMQDYDVVLLFGDNLNDFSDKFLGKSALGRRQEAERERAEFGKRFIVLPNPTYGDWEAALYKYNFKQSPERLQQIRMEELRR